MGQVTDTFCKATNIRSVISCILLLASSALTLLVGQQEGHSASKKRVVGIGMVMCLGQGADLQFCI